MADAPGNDMISELPDLILDHILSLMPAKAAAQTTILSRRWRDLWEYIWCFSTILDFTGEFAARQTPHEFVGNVNRYLKVHRGKKIKRFLVSLTLDWRFSWDVKQWLEFAAARDVEEISLEFTSYAVSSFPFTMPIQLFDCLRLRALRLRYCCFAPSPDFARLRSLTTLSLANVDVTGDDVRNVISECRLLERLLLIHCRQIDSIKLTSPHIKLKELVLGGVYLPPFDLEISVPSLRSFHFFGQMPFTANSFNEAAGLVDAFICPTNKPNHHYVRLLLDLGHVEILTVSTIALMCVTESWPEPGRVPLPLRNLRELQLIVIDLLDYNIPCIYVFFMLSHLPLLERLFVWLPRCDDMYLYNSDASDELSSSAVAHAHDFNQLKVIKMNNFKGSVTEMQLLRFLLQKTPVLELLELVAPRVLEFLCCDDMWFVQRRVLALPRVSRGAQIVVCKHLQDDTKHRATHDQHIFEWESL